MVSTSSKAIPFFKLRRGRGQGQNLQNQSQGHVKHETPLGQCQVLMTNTGKGLATFKTYTRMRLPKNGQNCLGSFGQFAAVLGNRMLLACKF